jgi:pilus assembly protein FimV
VLRHRAKILGVGLLLFCAAFGSQALTFGRVRGAALVGKPLDMVVPVQMAAGESTSSLCFDAEVFHADARQDASRVQVAVEAASQPNTLNVRVLSSAPVDEPVVTVYLRAGCGQKITRRFVLLADLPSETAPPVLAAPPTALAKTSVAASGAELATPADIAPRPAPSRPTRVSNAAGTSAKKAAGVKPILAPEAASAQANRPRLKLDPLALFSDRMANMETFMTFEAPQDALDSMKKMKALEASVSSLQSMVAKSDARLADLQGRLQTSESERFSKETGYALIALVLLSLTALGWVWYRQRATQNNAAWWDGSDTAPKPDAQAESPSEPAELLVSEAAAAPVKVRAPEPSTPASGVDVNLTEMTDSDFHDFMPPAKAAASAETLPVPVALPEMPAQEAKRSNWSELNLNSDEILDIRQQSEFFASLGQTDRATKLLLEHVNGSGEPNPLLYLDLLTLLHSLSLKAEFQHVRLKFEKLFCVRLPSFAAFKNEGSGLESYPAILAHIAALWPSPQVVSWIEGCIFQKASEVGNQGYDLAAFRDLLLLHSVACHLLATFPPPDGEPPQPKAQPTATQADMSLLPNVLPDISAASQEMSLDLDLSDEPLPVAPVSRAGNANFPKILPDSLELELEMPIDVRKPDAS